MFINILIPIHNNAFELLENCLNSVFSQTFNDYSIIITDQNDNDFMYEKILSLNNPKIKYYKSSLKGWSNNHNNGLKYCDGDLIKILHYDNYFYHNNALQEIHDCFLNNDIYWLVSSYYHLKNNIICDLHNPKYHELIHLGHNLIGDPTCLTFKNNNILFFDENLTFYVDCDYYKRLFDIYGLPFVLTNPTFVCRIHDLQTTNICTEESNNIEYNYIMKKYKKN